jgi:hypothetical protein
MRKTILAAAMLTASLALAGCNKTEVEPTATDTAVVDDSAMDTSMPADTMATGAADAMATGAAADTAGTATATATATASPAASATPM